ncbi:MAG: PDZ domain-containing protein [Candidatus Aminicenantes bacterium]|nr:PDZ domain-containing protein [Candidatus Aminicenantes bacterium]
MMVKSKGAVNAMNIKKLRITLVTVWVALCLFFLLEKNFLPGLSGKNAADDRMKLVGSAAYLIRDEYVEEPSPATTMEGAFRGLVDSLDILSSYLDKESLVKYRQRKDSDLFGPGLLLFKNQGRFPLVVAVKENSPGEQAGIQLGESISAINGRSTLMMSMVEANLILKDKTKKPVRLKVLRGSDTRVVEVERSPMADEAYSFAPQESLSGILKISNFYPPCASRFREDLVPKLASAQKPLVLDLRYCAEGEIGEAQAFLNILLNQSNIGYLKKKGDTRENLSLQGKSVLSNLPLIVWTSQATIGAAEIVAGVLREFKSVKIIGRRSPGLVSQQAVIPLEDGSGLLLTSSVFYLNAGEPIWNKGIEPDIEIGDDDPSFAAYLEKTLNLISNL